MFNRTETESTSISINFTVCDGRCRAGKPTATGSRGRRTAMEWFLLKRHLLQTRFIYDLCVILSLMNSAWLVVYCHFIFIIFLNDGVCPEKVWPHSLPNFNNNWIFLTNTRKEKQKKTIDAYICNHFLPLWADFFSVRRRITNAFHPLRNDGSWQFCDCLQQAQAEEQKQKTRNGWEKNVCVMSANSIFLILICRFETIYINLTEKSEDKTAKKWNGIYDFGLKW